MAGAVGGTATVKASPGLTLWLASFIVAPPEDDRALFQQLLQPRAAEIGQGGGQEAVQPPAGMVVAGDRAR